MNKKTLGCEIEVNSYESVCLFLGCKVLKHDEDLERLHDFCRYSASENFPFDPQVGKVFGVYHSGRKKWTRGKVKEILHYAKESQFKVFLIDFGEYVTVKKKHMVKLSGLMEFPAQCMRIGLDGVLPALDMCDKIRNTLIDYIHKGRVYFREKRRIKSVFFGNIVIISDNPDPIDLTTSLLSKGFVKEVDNFEQEITTFLDKFTGFKEDLGNVFEEKVVSKTIDYTSDERSNTQRSGRGDDKPRRKYENEVRVGSQSQSSKPQPDTGYSSEENFPFVREDTIFLPAGYHVSQKRKERQSSRDAPKIPPTYYELKFRGSSEHRSRSQGRRNEPDSLCTNRESSERRDQQRRSRSAHSKYYPDLQECPPRAQPVFKPKRVSWGSTSYEDIDTSTPKDNQPQKRTRAFNLNFRSEEQKGGKEMPESIITKGTIQPITQIENNPSPEFQMQEKPDVNQSNAQSSPKENNLNVSGGSSTSGSNQLMPKTHPLLSRYKDEVLKKEARDQVKSTVIKESRQGSDKSVTDLSGNEADRSISSIKSASVSLNSPNISNPAAKVNTSAIIDSTNPSLNSPTTVTSNVTNTSSGNFNSTSSLNSSYNRFSDGSSTSSVRLSPWAKKQIIRSKYLQSGGRSGDIDFQTPSVKELTGLASETSGNKTQDLGKQMSQTDQRSEQNLSTIEPKTATIPSQPYKCTNARLKKLWIREKYQQQKLVNASDSETSSQSSFEVTNVALINQNSEVFGNSQKLYSERQEMRLKMNELMAPSEEEKRGRRQNFMESRSNEDIIQRVNSAAGVLVHTKDDRIIPPCAILSESNLDTKIIRSLERWNLRELSRVQMFSYPTIAARRNVVIIGPPGSGKTSGYVVPLASNLLDPDFYTSLPDGNGPRAIIITPYWQSGGVAAGMFTDLMQSIKVIHCYGGGAELELKVPLLNGCDVLVSTPRCLLRLLECGVTNIKRLCHIVIDDADVMLVKFQSEINKLMIYMAKLDESREKAESPVQLQVILAAAHWTPPLEVLAIRIMEEQTLIIASQLEACVYAGIKPTAVFIDSARKMEKLVMILKEIEGKKRVVVVCKSKTDVDTVYKLLTDLGVKNLIAAHENLPSTTISELPNVWNKEEDLVAVTELWSKSASLPILIRSDEVLEECPVSNAQVLIHYNMPSSLKTFSLRFISLMDNYRNVLKKESAKRKCDVYILIDEENDLELSGVMNFMQRLKTVLPDSVKQTLEKTKDLKENKKINEPLCEDLKQFGECWDVKSCSSRHILSREQDLPQDIPDKGLVKILVQHVHNGCHFSARLLEHAENKDDWQKVSTDTMVLAMKLNNFYGKMSNRRPHGFPSVDDIVAIESSVDVFQRAIVLKITQFNKRGDPEFVNIRLIDNGSYKYNVPIMHLYGLPAELKSYPAAVVDVYLCRVLPQDEDISWSDAIQTWVESQLRDLRRDSPSGYLQGKIVLSIGRSLWLDPVEFIEYLPGIGMTVTRLSLRIDLLKNKMAVDNPDHVTKLRRLCQKAGIEIREEEKQVVQKVEQPKPAWAWLPQDRGETVHLITVQAVNSLFVRLSYLSGCLQNLVGDIQISMKKYKVSESVKELDIGDICLGRSGDEWNRAMIYSKPSDEEVELFFVDYGDFATLPWSDVASISDEFIIKLPFQVIECSLAGIKFPESLDPSWEDDVINHIYDLTRNKDEEALNLLVKVCGVEPMGTISKGRKYKVVLSDTEKNLTLNEELVSSNFAQYIEEERNLLTITKEAIPVEESSYEESDLSIDREKKKPSTENMQIVTTMQTQDKFQVLLQEQFNISDEIACDEKEQRVLQFLKDIEAGEFEYSGFNIKEGMEHSENDADVSENENYSEGSVLSLPKPRRSLPQIKSSDATFNSDVDSSSVSEQKETCEIINEEYLNSLNNRSSNASLKYALNHNSNYEQNNSSVLKKENENGEQYEILNQKCLQLSENSTPLVHSSPKGVPALSNSFTIFSPVSAPTKPVNVIISSESSSSSCISPGAIPKITGQATSFLEMVSPSLLNSSLSNNSSLNLNLVEKVSPLLRSLSHPSLNIMNESNEDKINNEEEKEKGDEEGLVMKVTKNQTNQPAFSPNSARYFEGELKYSCSVKEECALPNNHLEIAQDKTTSNSPIFKSAETESSQPQTNLCKWVEERIISDTDEESISTNQHREIATDKQNSESENPLSNKQTLEKETKSAYDAIANQMLEEGVNSCKVRCPLVEWHQNDKFIWIHIKLPEIKHYKFSCDDTSIEFRAVYEQLVYKVSLQLFGGHKSEAVAYTPKAFHFEIRLEKLLKGPRNHWPRLIESEEKPHWLSINVEKALDNMEESEDEDVKRHACLMRNWNENPSSDTTSEMTEASDLCNSELSATFF